MTEAYPRPRPQAVTGEWGASRPQSAVFAPACGGVDIPFGHCLSRARTSRNLLPASFIAILTLANCDVFRSYPQANWDGFDVDRYCAAFLTCFFLFTRARARDARKALSGKGWEKFQDRFNSAFFRVISAFFRVTLPFSGCYPQNSAKTEIRQNSCNLPKNTCGRDTRRLAELAKKTSLERKAQGYESTDLDRPAGERWVTMSNALTRAAHGLTLGEKRIIMAAVSKLDSRRAAVPGQVPTTKITAAEYAELAKCGMNAAYEALQTAATNLYDRSITIYQPSYKRGSKKIGDKGTVTRMRWVGRATYHEKEGWVELAWWHEVVPHLMGLRQQFTSYQLQQANALRSIYSWRLLELLTRFKSSGVAEYSIEDFATSMNATDKQRADFAAIRRKIIEPAVKELVEKDGWLIEWVPVKAGRKVAGVHFEFKRDPQGRLDV